MTSPTRSTRVPYADLPTFLRWVVAQPNRGPLDPEDKEMEAIISELANVLEDHPDNTLAQLILSSTGLNDLTSIDVAGMYGAFCADQRPGGVTDGRTEA